jgi:TolB-like protein/tetratricopeptide (TPR) repeat protein
MHDVAPDSPPPTDPLASPDAPGATAAAKKKKKKDKVRSAWISFIGRIVAQIVGAVASIVLAIMFLQRTQGDDVAQSVKPEPAVQSPRKVAARADGRIAVAVLPLSNYSGDPAQDYFADGMTEALIADLAQIDGLRVISRTSVMQYRKQQKTIPEVAAELGVDMIVEGSVVRAGDRVRVTAQLIDAAGDHHIWSRSYEHTMRDVLALQGRVAAEIAKEVKGALTPRQQGRLSTGRRAIDPTAYDLYLRGRHAWSLRTEVGFKAAVSYFEQAIQRDPQFALAYAGLADVYLLPSTRPALSAPSDARTKANAAVARALELDDSLAEAHTSRAGLHFFHERDFAAAEREFKKALDLNPGYPSARQWYAILLAEAGRDAEALANAREAVALDPLNGTMHQSLGLVHYYGRRYSESITELGRALDLSPQLPLPRAIMAKAYFQQSAYADAIKIVESAPEPRNADLETMLGLSYLRSGDAGRANAILQRLRAQKPLPVVSLAQWNSVTGDANAAVELLAGGNLQGSIPAAVSVDPLFDGIRNDARFQALIKRGRL